MGMNRGESYHSSRSYYRKKNRRHWCDAVGSFFTNESTSVPDEFRVGGTLGGRDL